MFRFVILAHEEGVSTGQAAWLGPVLFFGIVILSAITAQLIRRRWGKWQKSNL